MHEGHPVLAIADVNGGAGGAGALGVVYDQALRAAVDEARPDHRGGDRVVGRFERQALVRRAPGDHRDCALRRGRLVDGRTGVAQDQHTRGINDDPGRAGALGGREQGLDRHAVGGDGVAVVEGDVQERIVRRGRRLITRRLIERAAVWRRPDGLELSIRNLAARKARHLVPAAA